MKRHKIVVSKYEQQTVQGKVLGLGTWRLSGEIYGHGFRPSSGNQYVYHSLATFSTQIAAFNHVWGFAGIKNVGKDWQEI